MADALLPSFIPVEAIKLIIKKLKGEDVPFWDVLRAADEVLHFVIEKGKELSDLFMASPVKELDDSALQSSLEGLLVQSEAEEVRAFDWKSLLLSLAKLIARLILEA